MGRNSHIEWTDHTFNPWWGCAKVSPACAHCYAEPIANRFGGAEWGLKGTRRVFGEDHWQNPLKWNAEAAEAGTRYRVFCASMADVYEDRPELVSERQKLWDLVGKTKSLDWLILTKRPENVRRLSPWGGNWPGNIWLGTSVENQEWADTRLPHLLAVPARVRFLSCEPLLGALNLETQCSPGAVHWIIAGGESGPGARPMHPDWVRSLRDFSGKQKIAFHFKQWGRWSPAEHPGSAKTLFRFEGNGPVMAPVGKKLGGRLLDGKTHDGFPL